MGFKFLQDEYYIKKNLNNQEIKDIFCIDIINDFCQTNNVENFQIFNICICLSLYHNRLR